MLIKEYRIPMPMTVEEYRIAQLYMIQKKSREESQGTESGVEIIENEPYSDGPGGNGQHTFKIYHIGKHIPGWLVSLLPKDALIVEEEAWNAYPYTRTRYTCPFVDRFSIDIETLYFNDAGDSKNVFEMSASELRNTVVDVIDIVKEKSSDYKKEEDPKLFKSNKTGRGPLTEDWLSKCKSSSLENRPKIMCAYKKCKVEFKYWGMQSKIEKFIHDIGLRKVMLRAHKQAWCWQDEWYGLNMDDIRRLEKETQLALRLKFGTGPEGREDLNESEELAKEGLDSVTGTNNQNSLSTGSNEDNFNSTMQGQNSVYKYLGHRGSSGSVISSRSKLSNTERYVSQINLLEGTTSIDGIRRYSTDSNSDDDEFFDARDNFEEDSSVSSHSMPYLRGSIERLAESVVSNDEISEIKAQDSVDAEEQVESVASATCNVGYLILILHGGNGLESSPNGFTASKQNDLHTLKTTFNNVIKSHYKAAFGRVAFRLVACPPVCNDAFQLLRRLNPHGHHDSDAVDYTLPSSMLAMSATMSASYHETLFSLASKCNKVYSEFLDSPEGKGFDGQVCVVSDTIGSIMTYDMLCRCSNSNLSMSNSRRGSSVSTYEDEEDFHHVSAPSSPSFRLSPQHKWELTASHAAPRRGSATSALGTGPDNSFLSVTPHNSVQLRRASANCCIDVQQRSSSCSGPPSQALPRSSVQTSTSSELVLKLNFEVADLFMLGSPLGLILALRQLKSGTEFYSTPHSAPAKPACRHVYNLFYSADPSSARIEPLIDSRFSRFTPVAVAKFPQFPFGDGQSVAIGDLLSQGSDFFSDDETRLRRSSEWSVSSGSGLDLVVSGKLQQNLSATSSNSHGDDDPSLSVSSEIPLENETLSVASRWWGEKRIDYALFCPEALTKFPSTTLPYLFHSSFWESFDLAAFILRQVVKLDFAHSCSGDRKPCDSFVPSIPQEKWQKKRTLVKIRNVAANHRAKDSVALENQPQVISGRFVYGLLDMVNLTGEIVDLYALLPSPSSEWIHLGSELTNGHGKVTFTIPAEQSLGLGMYPMKLVARGDLSTADCYLAVLPPHTDAVVFSIHGALSASVSIMGSDPKVRPGAVDVVRFWQEKGYLIIYITGRPDIQKFGVLSWLAQHNFPHGLIWFGDGLSHEPLKQKTLLLKSLKTECKLQYEAAYGSTKDIAVYSQLDVSRERIFVIGKTSKKQSQQCSVVNIGYSTHLEELSALDVRAAKYNSMALVRKSCFHLPESNKNRNSLRKSKSSGKRQASIE